MNFAICHLSVVSVRASAADRSEMLTQLLFGECVEILDKKGKLWIKIRCLSDNTIGWSHRYQLTNITPSEKDIFHEIFAYSLEYIQPIMGLNFSRPVTIGARLPNFDGLRCSIGEEKYNFSGQAIFPQEMKANADLIIKLARKYLQAPFLSGGRSPLGIDAGALTQLVFSFVNIGLQRFPDQQVTQGRTVDFVQQSQAGDLAFFENKAGNITHVGILLPERKIIHAFGQVRIDNIDHYGIFNEGLQKYTHRLRIVRRLLEDTELNQDAAQEEAAVIENQIGLF